MQIPIKSVKYLPCICLRTTWVWAAVTIPTTISRLSSPSQSSMTNACRRPLVTGCTQCALWDRKTRASPFPKWWGWRVSSLSWSKGDGFCGPWGDAKEFQLRSTWAAGRFLKVQYMRTKKQQQHDCRLQAEGLKLSWNRIACCMLWCERHLGRSFASYSGRTVEFMPSVHSAEFTTLKVNPRRLQHHINGEEWATIKVCRIRQCPTSGYGMMFHASWPQARVQIAMQSFPPTWPGIHVQCQILQLLQNGLQRAMRPPRLQVTCGPLGFRVPPHFRAELEDLINLLITQQLGPKDHRTSDLQQKWPKEKKNGRILTQGLTNWGNKQIADSANPR